MTPAMPQYGLLVVPTARSEVSEWDFQDDMTSVASISRINFVSGAVSPFHLFCSREFYASPSRISYLSGFISR
jgi:hypothetical protein